MESRADRTLQEERLVNLKTAIETTQNGTRSVKNQAAQEGGGHSVRHGTESSSLRPGRGQGGDRKTLEEVMARRLSNFDENYKPTYLRSSTNPKDKKWEENYNESTSHPPESLLNASDKVLRAARGGKENAV